MGNGAESLPSSADSVKKRGCRRWRHLSAGSGTACRGRRRWPLIGATFAPARCEWAIGGFFEEEAGPRAAGRSRDQNLELFS